jgi:5-methylcytosine-specific restriction endonuclease McrBC GTP-binding regulatory subunit McrB
VAGSRPQTEPRPRLTLAIWRSWRATADRVPDIDKIERQIGELNSILERLGRPFGHRLFQAIVLYHANHPATRRRDPGADNITLADQLEFRILPRLRGLETDRHQTALDELRQFLEKLEDEPLVEAFGQAREAEFFFWPGTVRDRENDAA